ncbi:dhal domain-containing protein [Fusarium oxysporum]|nr:dhal domain-containing protein [Fusarium oxysporum]
MACIAEGIKGKSFISGVNNPVERTLRGCVLQDLSLNLIVSEKRREHPQPRVSGQGSPQHDVRQLDEELEKLLDAPTTAPAWPRSIHEWATDAEAVAKRDVEYINGVDTQERKTGVMGLVKEFQHDDVEFLDIGQIFRRTATTAERSMGGTSGAIYVIFLNAVANSLPDQALAKPSTNLSGLIRTPLQRGLDELCRYTPACIGHRTLMDALIPFVRAYASEPSLRDAVLEARKGAECTRQMTAMLGRASYVGRDRFNEEGGIPDPRALGMGYRNKRYELKFDPTMALCQYRQKWISEPQAPVTGKNHTEVRDLKFDVNM